jgi:hypothetical protein
MISLSSDSRNVHAALEVLARLPMYLQVEMLQWVDDFVLDVQAQAQEKTPVDSGVLQGSARSNTSLRGERILGEITFGGIAAAYAEVQHERDDFRHPKGGQAHWLYGAEDSAWSSEVEREFFVLAAREAERLMQAGRHYGSVD